MAPVSHTHRFRAAVTARWRLLAAAGSALALVAALVLPFGAPAAAAESGAAPADSKSKEVPDSDAPDTSDSQPADDESSESNSPDESTDSGSPDDTTSSGTDDATPSTSTSSPSGTESTDPATTESTDPTTTSTSGTDTPSTTTSTSAAVQRLIVEPKRISAKNFVSKKKGVLLAVTGLTPGTTVNFRVQPDDSSIDPYTLTVTADAKGNAQWSVYGTNPANPSVYVGSYGVTAQVAGGKTFKGSFRVTSGDANGGGSGNGGSDGGNGGGSGDGWLPRTGAELTAAGVGAVLLLIGGAVVLITRRKKR